MGEVEEITKRNKSIEEVNLMPPLVWAYIGDVVYELYIRTKLVETTKLNPHKLHVETTKYVKAKAQAETLERIMKYLTEEEKEQAQDNLEKTVAIEADVEE